MMDFCVESVEQSREILHVAEQATKAAKFLIDLILHDIQRHLKSDAKLICYVKSH